MARTIKVESICGRCGRTEEATMGMQEAMDLDRVDEARDAADEALKETLNDALDESYPDVIVAVRQEDGSYRVKGLRNLCDQPNAKRNKGCATRVKALVNDVFMVPNPKPAKKVVPTEPEAGTKPPAAPEPPAEPESKNDGKNKDGKNKDGKKK